MNPRVDKLLNERTVSSFPISIGTAMALESLFNPTIEPYDKDRKIKRIKTKDWDTHLWSVKTIIRNMLGSVSSKYADLLYSNPATVLKHLVNEIAQIEELYRIEGKGVINPIFYWNDYTYLLTQERNPLLNIRPMTKRSRTYDLFTKRLFKPLDTVLTQSNRINWRVEPSFIPKEGTKVLLTTHVPSELLDTKLFKKLGLLESHTGTLKLRNMWYTKFYDYKSDPTIYSRIPFTKPTLYILGDHGFIKPHHKKERTLFLEMAKKRRFNITTTDEKIMYYLRSDMKIG